MRMRSFDLSLPLDKMMTSQFSRRAAAAGRAAEQEDESVH